jgi:hypothetical protein
MVKENFLPIQNNVGISEQFTSLVPFNIKSSFVNFLKFIYGKNDI